ncbi:MAG TPA: hypothetical protein VFV96_15630 [Verrucomicrobiae bacterium]|nr:hypothetical protein [Verrucomicrobiae bacterium]
MSTYIRSVLLAAGVASFALGVHAQSPVVGRWNLGEQDAGAVAGNAGNPTTTDAAGTNDLAAVGAPLYSSNVPAGGSTLAMQFDGASCYQGSVLNNDGFDQVYSNLDFNNFSLSCDVNVTAPGAAGYSFLVSLGDNRAGGIAIVEIGGQWELIHMGVVATSGGPAVATNTWTHLDLIRKNFGSGVETRLFVNGADSGLAIASSPNTPQDFFTIGANELNSDIPGDVEGYFNGLVDNVVVSNLNVGMPPTLGGITASPGTIYAGNSIILTADNVTGDAGSRAFAWRLNGQVVTNTTTPSVTLTNATSSAAGGYDVILSTTFGAVTSAVVNVAVEDPALSAGVDVARYRLGEDDAGAAAGNPGAAMTKDSVGTAELPVFGAPSYSANVPAGGSTLSLSFDGGSYYGGSSDGLTNLYASLDFNNFSLSCDVYMTAPGSAGFSFPVAMGQNGSGGFSIVEIGGEWHVFQQSISQSAGVPAALNQWTHLELQRRKFGSVVRSRLFVNGVDAGVSATAGPDLPITPLLAIGGNFKNDGVSTEGLFSGQIDNVVVHDYSVGLPPQVDTLTASPLHLLPSGESLSLSASGISGQLPMNFSWRRNGTVFTNTTSPTLTLNGVTTNWSGVYDLVVSNPVGAVTSSIVNLTVLLPGVSVGTTVARYRLGEDDAGATAGGAGAAFSKDIIGTNDLATNGTPVYSSEVPGGGSALSVAFDGASFYQSSGAGLSNLYAGVDWDNCSLSCDVYLTAAGSGGFSFPLSIGGTGAGGGGFALVEVGGNWAIINHGVELSSAGPAIPLNTWQHVEVVRRNFGGGVQTRLLLDGVDAGVQLDSAPNPPPAFLTVGANRSANNVSGIEGPFNGLVDNVELKSFNLVPPAVQLRSLGNQIQVDCAGRARANLTLWRSPGLSPATWSAVTNGVTDNLGTALFTDPNPPAGTAFYRATMP